MLIQVKQETRFLLMKFNHLGKELFNLSAHVIGTLSVNQFVVDFDIAKKSRVRFFMPQEEIYLIKLSTF